MIFLSGHPYITPDWEARFRRKPEVLNAAETLRKFIFTHMDRSISTNRVRKWSFILVLNKSAKQISSSFQKKIIACE